MRPSDGHDPRSRVSPDRRDHHRVARGRHRLRRRVPGARTAAARPASRRPSSPPPVLGQRPVVRRPPTWYVEHGLDRVTAWGWQIPACAPRFRRRARPRTPRDPRRARPWTPPPAAAPARTSRRPASTSRTSPRSPVDLLVRISGGALKTVRRQRLRAAPARRSPRSTGSATPQLLLAGDRAVVIGSEVDDPAAGAPLMAPPPRTRVLTSTSATPATRRSSTRAGTTGRWSPPGSSAPPFGSCSTAGCRTRLREPYVLGQSGGGPGPQPGVVRVHRRPTGCRRSRRTTPRRTVLGSPPGTRSSTAPTSRCPRRNGLGTLTVVGFDPATPDQRRRDRGSRPRPPWPTCRRPAATSRPHRGSRPVLRTGGPIGCR